MATMPPGSPPLSPITATDTLDARANDSRSMPAVAIEHRHIAEAVPLPSRPLALDVPRRTHDAASVRLVEGDAMALESARRAAATVPPGYAALLENLGAQPAHGLSATGAHVYVVLSMLNSVDVHQPEWVRRPPAEGAVPDAKARQDGAGPGQ